MVEQIRNLGRAGVASMAIAVDNALWDLKGKLLKISVAALLGLVRTRILAYGAADSPLIRIRNCASSWAVGLNRVFLRSR